MRIASSLHKAVFIIFQAESATKNSFTLTVVHCGHLSEFMQWTRHSWNWFIGILCSNVSSFILIYEKKSQGANSGKKGGVGSLSL